MDAYLTCVNPLSRGSGARPPDIEPLALAGTGQEPPQFSSAEPRRTGGCWRDCKAASKTDDLSVALLSLKRDCMEALQDQQEALQVEQASKIESLVARLELVEARDWPGLTAKVRTIEDGLAAVLEDSRRRATLEGLTRRSLQGVGAFREHTQQRSREREEEGAAAAAEPSSSSSGARKAEVQLLLHDAAEENSVVSAAELADLRRRVKHLEIRKVERLLGDDLASAAEAVAALSARLLVVEAQIRDLSREVLEQSTALELVQASAPDSSAAPTPRVQSREEDGGRDVAKAPLQPTMLGISTDFPPDRISISQAFQSRVNASIGPGSPANGSSKAGQLAKKVRRLEHRVHLLKYPKKMKVDLSLGINDAGNALRQGTDDYRSSFYCGLPYERQWLPHEVVEDLVCGPESGPMCPSCARYADKGSAGREKWMAELSAMDRHQLQETAWESTLLIGMEHMGRAASGLVLVALCLNMVVQILFFLVLLHALLGDGDRHDMPTVPSIQDWRGSVAHHVSFMDPYSGKSLARRICDGDRGLHWSAEQASLYSAVAAFSTPALGSSTGLVSGVAAQLVWICVVLKQIRGGCISFYRAVQNIKVDTKTSLSTFPQAKVVEFEIESITSLRRLSVLSLIILRACISSALLVLGSLWLSRATGLQDMLTRLLTLTLIVESDGCLFRAVTPMTTQVFVRNLRPLSKRRVKALQGVELHSFVIVLAVAVYVAVVGLVPISMHAREIAEAGAALCEGSLDFVWGASSTGEVWAATAAPRDEPSSSFQRDAVLELVRVKATGEAATMSQAAQSLEHLAFVVEAPLAEYTRAATCQDASFADPGRTASVLALRAQMAAAASPPQAAAAALLFRGCSDPGAAELCRVPELALLRMLCPEACGCASAPSALLSAGPESGCPASCRPAARPSAPCEDDARLSGPWAERLASVPRALAHTQQLLGPGEAGLVGRAAAALALAGCPGIPAYVRDAGPALLLWHPCGGPGEGRFATLRAFCPEACNCSSLTPLPADCPASCATHGHPA